MKIPSKPYTYSKHEKNLWFNNKPPGKTIYFEHQFKKYALEGRILYGTKAELPFIYSIHGARADFTKADIISFELQQYGYSILSINMSGHSKASPLKPEQTTLGDNIYEVETFYQYLNDKRKKIVIAYSLGGTPALKLLEKHSSEINKLILFYPGIYTVDSYNKHFGDEFRSIVTKPFSYRNNDTIALLKSFKGKLLLIKGQYDGLDPRHYGKPIGGSVGKVLINNTEYYSPIPKDVMTMVFQAIPNARRQLIEIPLCGHSVILWMRDHPTEAKLFLKQIDTFLKS